MLVRVLICARCAACTAWGTGVLALLALSVNCLAADFTLSWKASPYPNVIGYNIYYGAAPGNYTNVVPTGPSTSATIPSLVPGTTYYFAITCCDISGLEGPFSIETSYTVPVPNQPPALDPIPDVVLNENNGVYAINLTGISSGATDEVQTLTVTASSSNPNIVPNPTVNYTSPNTAGTLSFTPTAKAFGSVTITVTVDDGQAFNNTATRSFAVTINQRTTRPVLQISPANSPNLTVLGQVGATYQLQFATGLPPETDWHPLLTFVQTNAAQVINVRLEKPFVLFRLVQQ